jgi:hypothetical protein
MIILLTVAMGMILLVSQMGLYELRMLFLSARADAMAVCKEGALYPPRKPLNVPKGKYGHSLKKQPLRLSI